MRKKYKGSYTLEAAWISSLWIFLILSLFMIFTGTVKKGVYTAAAYEAALAGSTDAVRKTGNGTGTAEERLKEYGDLFYVKENKKTLSAGYRETLKFPYNGLSWKLTGEARCRIVRPVVFINRIRGLEKIRDGE